MDQLPNYTSHSNEYDAIDHGTSELDPKHAILVEKVTWHHSLIFHLNPLTSLRYSWTGHPWLCSPHCITNLHPNEAHPNPTARGGRNHTLPTGHIYPPLKPKSKYEQPSSSPGVTAGICHMAILKILVGMLPSLMWLVRKEMIYNSTSALTASYQHTVVEFLVNWPIRIPTKNMSHQNLQRNYPHTLDIHPITVHTNYSEHANNYETTLTSQHWTRLILHAKNNRKSHAMLLTIFYDETKHVFCVVCVLTTN